MQLTSLIKYISSILSRGHYFEKHDVNGKQITKRKITNLHILAIVLGLLSPIFIRKGFSSDFAGYTVGFLGIFVGLFASIVLSMYDKRLQLLNEIRQRELPSEAEEEVVEDSPNIQSRLKKAKNHLRQFTGLTSVSILTAFFLIISLLLVLLFPSLSLNPFKFQIVTDKNALNSESILLGFKLTLAVFHRIVTIYLLIRFFLTSIYSISSYFAFLNSQYKKL